jgi:hypothetical protein
MLEYCLFSYTTSRLGAEYELRRHGFNSTMRRDETEIMAEYVATEMRLMNAEKLADSR